MNNPAWVVKSVTPSPDYTLRLTFADGKTGIYNAKPLLEKKIYAPLKNIAFFMQAKADGCSVAWNDSIDIAPEHLYDEADPLPDEVEAFDRAMKEIADGETMRLEDVDWDAI